MQWPALAFDYDDTVAHQGVIDPATRAALVRWRASGRRLVLVTGRTLESLVHDCRDMDLFDRVVSENGGVLVRPPGRAAASSAEPS